MGKNSSEVKRQNKIKYDCLIGDMLIKKGLTSMTFKNVSKELGIPVPSLQCYYHTKSEILINAIANNLSKLITTIKKNDFLIDNLKLEYINNKEFQELTDIIELLLISPHMINISKNQVSMLVNNIIDLGMPGLNSEILIKYVISITEMKIRTSVFNAI